MSELTIDQRGFVTIVTIILVNAIRTNSSWFLAVAVVVAFVGFVGTTAGATDAAVRRVAGGRQDPAAPALDARTICAATWRTASAPTRRPRASRC